MKTTLTILTCLFLYSFLQAQNSVSWIQYTEGISIATDMNNNVYTVNYEYNPGGDIHLTKRNADGVFQWESVYDNTDPVLFESSTWVETDHAGNVIVTGTINSGYSNPVKANSIVMKYDSNGVLLWRNVYETFFDGSYTKKCLVDNNNNIYVLGMGSSSNGFVTKIKKFAPDGTVLWSFFDNAGIGVAFNFKFSRDNKLLIVGRSAFGSVNGFAKIDLDGNHIWSQTGLNSVNIGDAAGDSEGNTYLTTGEYVFNGGTLIKKLDPAGTQTWSNAFPFAGLRIEVGNDNLPVVCGFPNSGSGGAAFLKVDQNGNQIWYNADADGSAYNLLMHAQLKIDAYNNAYLAAGTLFEMAICKINQEGNSIYTLTTPGSYANGFSIGADNNIYVVGGATAKITQTPPPQDKILQLSILLEGLYTGNGSMRKALNTSGNQFPENIADQIQIELHDATNYNTLILSLNNVNLNCDGTATLIIPSQYNANYFLTLKHRNSLEIVSASPVSFASNGISYSFDHSNKAFGSKLKSSADGAWLAYSGDINQDGIINELDIQLVYDQTAQFTTGYSSTDLNGDAVVDAEDLILIDNQFGIVQSATP
ncbi:MAG: hypothetical protein IPH84_17275 [Bacteroidales bacterium]|nr:hypothetical protein [Bacteroidales bacterium]